jgi:periplasmic divalent cation tolerance protein
MACLIFTTCPNEKIAKRISEELLKKKLAACINIIPKIKSMYWWGRKIEKSDETLLLIKTGENLFDSVKKEVVKIHPYEIPEVICVKIDKGYEKYLDWMEKVVR